MSRPQTAEQVAAVVKRDPETERHFEAIRARLARYRAFQRFLEDAPGRLPRLYATLGIGRFYRDWYSLCVTPGGAMGGLDPRTLEVFFGQRPFDEAFVPTQLPAVPFMAGSHLRTVTDRGARLIYQRTDHGRVMCLLKPAGTLFTSSREDMIRLADVDPADLEIPAVLCQHLRLLLAYMAATSVDGIPFRGQRWHYACLYLFRPWHHAEKDKWMWSRAAFCAYKVGKWVVTIGLSGLLLYGIQRIWPLPETVTPAIEKAEATAHRDRMDLRNAVLEATRPTVHAKEAVRSPETPPAGANAHDH